MAGERESILMPGERIGLALVGMLLLGLLVTAVDCPPEPRKEVACQYKLENITIANSAYRKDLGEFPPAKNATELARMLSSRRMRDEHFYGPYMGWVDPGFLDPERCDFRLRPGSPLASREAEYLIWRMEPAKIDEMRRFLTWATTDCQVEPYETIPAMVALVMGL